MTDDTLLSDDEFGRHRRHQERERSVDRLADVGEALVATIQDFVAAAQGLTDAVTALQNRPDTTHLSADDQSALDGAVGQLQSATAALQAIVNPPAPESAPPPQDVAAAVAPGGTSIEQSPGLTP